MNARDVLPPPAARCNVLLVSPAFPVATFWNNKAAVKVAGARHSTVPLGLLTVAALLPPEWTCRLVDRNVGELADADLDWADLVMTGGMNVQRYDCLAVIARAQARGKVVVVGGPDVTSEPHPYAHADFVVTGEAEVVLHDFVAAWEAGQRQGRFAAEKFKVDVTQSPVPRYDLLHRSDYLYLSVQFSRGCPFNCEFCDIIELYGRVPRVKSVEQVLRELDALYASGHRGHVDFVDDNFIGNKKAVKAFLPHLIDWQARHGHPFILSTEASVNLADDEALLGLMRAAGFYVVFVGIESPDGDTLVATRKKQNARRSLSDSLDRIYRAGMFVIAGFIVGFDTEKGQIADEMVACIEETGIAIAMAGLLTALPNTQLATRLRRERRLFPVSWLEERAGAAGGDQCTLGLNFETRRPRRDVLADYRTVIDRIYTPRAFFGRVRRTARRLDVLPPSAAGPATGGGVLASLSREDVRQLLRLLREVLRVHPHLLGYYLKALLGAARDNPRSLRAVATMAAFYLHLGPFARVVSAAIDAQIAALDSGAWRSPPVDPSEPAVSRAPDRLLPAL